VVVKDHQTLMVNVFDPSLVKSVSSAIQAAQEQLNPQIQGSAVKVVVPRVTKEYRDSLAKKVPNRLR
jgi:ribosome recycling factor